MDFTTVPGRVPNYLAGRASEIAAVQDSLQTHDNLLLMGLRGTGKTTLLSKAESIASGQGWAVLSTYLDEGGLLDRVSMKLDLLTAGRAHKRFAGAQATVLGTGAGFDLASSEPRATIDTQIETLIQKRKVPGLLITIDEVHATVGAAQQHLRTLGNEIQLAQRRNLPVVAMMAGLPGGIRALLANKDENERLTAATFLRRAAKLPIGEISLYDVKAEYERAARENDLRISEANLELLARSAGGYSYLFQLLGRHVWRLASHHVITESNIRGGLRYARRDLGEAIKDTALGELSKVDRSFMLAMAQWESNDVPVGFVREYLGVSKQYVNNYRRRLLDSDMITAHDGTLRFALPYMRDFLREYAASQPDDDDWPEDWRSTLPNPPVPVNTSKQR